MKQTNQAPLEQQLDALYQQRKQNQPLPKQVANHIHQAAHKQHQASKKSAWLRPPIWASTFAACFVVVICVYMLPLAPALNDNAYPTSASAPVPVQTEALRRQPQTQVVQQSQAGSVIAQTQSLDINASRAFKAPPQEAAMSDEVTEGLMSKNVQAQYQGMTATSRQAAEEIAIQQVKDRTQKQSKQLQPAKMREVRSQARRFQAAPSAKKRYRVSLAQDSEPLASITAIDCNDEVITIEDRWLTELKPLQLGDWLLIEFDHQQHIITVVKSAERSTCASAP